VANLVECEASVGTPNAMVSMVKMMRRVRVVRMVSMDGWMGRLMDGCKTASQGFVGIAILTKTFQCQCSVRTDKLPVLVLCISGRAPKGATDFGPGFSDDVHPLAMLSLAWSLPLLLLLLLLLLYRTFLGQSAI